MSSQPPAYPLHEHRQPSPVGMPERHGYRYVGNLPPMPGEFPDYPAPVVREAGDRRELTMMRWGMPPPPRTGGPPVTNIRNTSSPHWRGWLKAENRCLVPANTFAEYAPEPNPQTRKKDVVWLALKEDWPLFAFAGIWTEFRGDRGTKSKPIPGPNAPIGEWARCFLGKHRQASFEGFGAAGSAPQAASIVLRRFSIHVIPLPPSVIWRKTPRYRHPGRGADAGRPAGRADRSADVFLTCGLRASGRSQFIPRRSRDC